MIRIEPDWNVNLLDTHLAELQALIRIEPDWNVNYKNVYDPTCGRGLE